MILLETMGKAGGKLLAAALLAMGGTMLAQAVEPPADFPFLPRTTPPLAAARTIAPIQAADPVKGSGKQEKTAKTKSKAVVVRESSTTSAPGQVDWRLKEAIEDQMGFNMAANTDAQNLEYMGMFGQEMYGPLPMASVHLEMEPDEAVLIFYKPAHDNSSFPVTLVQGGEKLTGRVSVKGSSTRGFIKKSLLVKIDKTSKGNWYGYRRISLNSMATDPSMVREWLSWDLARAAGLNVLNTFYTRLYINQKYVGLFLFTEWVTPELFDRDGLGTDGDLYQPDDSTYCGDLSLDSVERHCYSKYSPQDNKFDTLEKLARGVSTTPDGLFDKFVDANFYKDSLLNWIAVNGMVGNGDTYNKNYFLYYSRKIGQWEVMPWDYDLSFGRSWDPYLKQPNDVFNDNFVYYYTPDIGFPGMAKIKLLEDPVLFERFKKRIAHLYGIGKPEEGRAGYGWFSPERVAARINSIQTYTMQDAQQDTFSSNRIYSYEEQMEAMKYFALSHYSFLKTTAVGENTNWIFVYDPNMPLTPPPATASVMQASWTAQHSGYDRPLVDRASGHITSVIRVRSISKPTTLSTRVLSYQPPAVLPPGKSNRECVQRTWELTTKSSSAASLIADVTFEYMQENSHNSEVRDLVGRQKDLQLWLREGDAWTAQFTRTNSLAKTLTVRNLNIPANRTLQFVACTDAPANAGAEDTVAKSAKDVEIKSPAFKLMGDVYDRLKGKFTSPKKQP